MFKCNNCGMVFECEMPLQDGNELRPVCFAEQSYWQFYFK